MRIIRLMLMLLMMAVPAVSFAQIGITVSFGPPALPVYEQPICPGDGYMWTPGYWAWDPDISDYYWVPGTWVLAPEVGYLWTPGYWGWGGNGFAWYEGYWGPHIGFYGGINYGFGYFGMGYEGGHWDHDHFFYNRSVTNVNVTIIHNVYNTPVVNNNDTHVSYNGGNGGVNVRPRPEEEAAAHERHIPAVAAQTQHIQEARSNPQLRASANHGVPPIAATGRPGDFHSAVPAKAAGGEYRAPERGAAAGGAQRPAAGGTSTAIHPRDLPAINREQAPSSGNSKADKNYQKQQDKLAAQQDKERQKLQAQQDKEHQKQLSEAQNQKLEQKHQQQTQKLAERHAQQQRALQARQPAARAQPAQRPR